MKKNIFLGVNDYGMCCLLETFLSFDQLCKNSEDISSNDFSHSSTNWSGYDDIQRTLNIKNLVLTKRILKLPKKLFFRGRDYDHGHEYDWIFGISCIYETGDKPYNEYQSKENANSD